MYTTTISKVDYGGSNRQTSKIHRIKVILPQCYAAIAIFAVNFSVASFVSSNEISNYPPIGFRSLEYYDFIKCIALLIGGSVAQFINGRVMMTLGGAVSSVIWLNYYRLSYELIIKWLVYIIEITARLMQAPIYVYLAEISQPNTRSAIMAMVHLSSVLGWYFSRLTKTAMIASMNIIFPVLGLTMMLFLPDSPYWLANRGRYYQVKSSLAWFRGWTTAANVKSESKYIIDNAQKNLTVCKLFCNKSLYISILIVCCVFFVKAPIDLFSFMSIPHTRSLLTYLMNDGLIGTLVWDIPYALLSIAFVVLVAIIEKKTLILISLFGESIGLLLASVSVHSNGSQENNWLFIVSLIVANFSYIVGAVQVPLLLNGEIFPSRLRYLGVGFGLCFADLALFIFWKLIGIFGHLSAVIRFLTFACASMLGFIFLLWLFPRNENKSLVEIEQSSVSINNLRKTTNAKPVMYVEHAF